MGFNPTICNATTVKYFLHFKGYKPWRQHLAGSLLTTSRISYNDLPPDSSLEGTNTVRGSSERR